jgi:hypothetical protein
MITKAPIPLDLDNFWTATFSPSDTMLGLPPDLTGAQAIMTIYRKGPHRSHGTWWYGSPYSSYSFPGSISTETGEIVNANNKLTVSVQLPDGEYAIRGDLITGSQSAVVTPFINGVLAINKGMSQLSLQAMK